MPGLFDGMRIAKSGINTQRIMQEITGQNIANASNKDYTRQEARLTTSSSIWDGRHFLGQGSEVADITRIRDELLDDQIRNSNSTHGNYEVQMEWLNRIEAAYNEPSDHGIGAALSGFWESWSELGSNPENFATRSSLITRTETLTNGIQDLDSKLAMLAQQIDQELVREAQEINQLTEEIASLNLEIFEIESGRASQANDLRDRRDSALDRLSEHVNINHHEDANGTVSVFIGDHPAVIHDRAEKLETRNSSLDQTKLDLYWEYGDHFTPATTGSLAGVLNVRDGIIADLRSDLNTFSATIIEEVNALYSQGVAMEGSTLLESNLGYDALGTTKSTDPLSILSPGQYGNIHVSFYDSSGAVVRTGGIVVESDDSLADIQTKLNGIKGLDVDLLSSSDVSKDGRLRMKLNTISGENVMGEESFGISNNTDAFDTSGFLDLLNYSQVTKSTNLSAAAPVLASRDLTELQTVLGEPSLAAVRAKALGLSGTFTINAFETMTENTPKTDGGHVQQLAINVVSTDSIDSIIAKINTLTAQHGVSASVNGGTNQLEITSTARTDTDGNVLLAGGTDYLRLGFSNTYRYPTAINDEPPSHYTGRADTTGLLGQLQFNTLLQGDSASTIQLDTGITSADQIHAGFKLGSGANDLSLELANLQHGRVAVNNQFTINELYENLVSEVGTQVQEYDQLEQNEGALLEAFRTEKDRISGVNIDEELAKMIQYQRSYEANARMFSTFDRMAQEILNIIN